MTFGDAKKVIEEFLAQNKDVNVDDIAKMFVEKQKEFEMPDLDLGILLSSIGGEKFLTQGAIEALEKGGYMNGKGESQPKQQEEQENREEPEKEEEKPMEKEEPEKEEENNDEKEKEEVRKLYSGK